jgi:hypothetical protein
MMVIFNMTLQTQNQRGSSASLAQRGRSADLSRAMRVRDLGGGRIPDRQTRSRNSHGYAPAKTGLVHHGNRH